MSSRKYLNIYTFIMANLGNKNLIKLRVKLLIPIKKFKNLPLAKQHNRLGNKSVRMGSQLNLTTAELNIFSYENNAIEKDGNDEVSDKPSTVHVPKLTFSRDPLQENKNRRNRH